LNGLNIFDWYSYFENDVLVHRFENDVLVLDETSGLFY